MIAPPPGPSESELDFPSFLTMAHFLVCPTRFDKRLDPSPHCPSRVVTCHTKGPGARGGGEDRRGGWEKSVFFYSSLGGVITMITPTCIEGLPPLVYEEVGPPFTYITIFHNPVFSVLFFTRPGAGATGQQLSAPLPSTPPPPPRLCPFALPSPPCPTLVSPGHSVFRCGTSLPYCPTPELDQSPEPLGNPTLWKHGFHGAV